MNIEETLVDIFREYTAIDFDKDRYLRNKLLLGFELNLMPRDLIKILFEIEKRTTLKYLESDIINGKFVTFDSILQTTLKLK